MAQRTEEKWFKNKRVILPVQVFFFVWVTWVFPFIYADLIGDLPKG